MTGDGEGCERMLAKPKEGKTHFGLEEAPSDRATVIMHGGTLLRSAAECTPGVCLGEVGSGFCPYIFDFLC